MTMKMQDRHKDKQALQLSISEIKTRISEKKAQAVMSYYQYNCYLEYKDYLASFLLKFEFLKGI